MPSVLITGASKGIGRATAVEFARRGWRVIATAATGAPSMISTSHNAWPSTSPTSAASTTP